MLSREGINESFIVMLNCSSKTMELIRSESQRLNIIHYEIARKGKFEFDLQWVQLLQRWRSPVSIGALALLGLYV